MSHLCSFFCFFFQKRSPIFQCLFNQYLVEMLTHVLCDELDARLCQHGIYLLFFRRGCDCQRQDGAKQQQESIPKQAAGCPSCNSCAHDVVVGSDDQPD